MRAMSFFLSTLQRQHSANTRRGVGMMYWPALPERRPLKSNRPSKKRDVAPKKLDRRAGNIVKRPNLVHTAPTARPTIVTQPLSNIDCEPEFTDVAGPPPPRSPAHR